MIIERRGVICYDATLAQFVTFTLTHTHAVKTRHKVESILSFLISQRYAMCFVGASTRNCVLFNGKLSR